jgi:hypothetical protein
VWRVFPFANGPAQREGGPLWFPRLYQGGGRHDNPGQYGVLYLAEDEVAAIVEALAPFRGTGPLTEGLLRRAGRPLAMAQIVLTSPDALVDLDDPAVLVGEGLRPSEVATHHRRVTQRQALTLYHRHPEAAGLRWWSTFEATWAQITVFDRAAGLLRLVGTRLLALDQPSVRQAALFLGLV